MYSIDHQSMSVNLIRSRSRKKDNEINIDLDFYKTEHKLDKEFNDQLEI